MYLFAVRPLWSGYDVVVGVNEENVFWFEISVSEVILMENCIHVTSHTSAINYCLHWIRRLGSYLNKPGGVNGLALRWISYAGLGDISLER